MRVISLLALCLMLIGPLANAQIPPRQSTVETMDDPSENWFRNADPDCFFPIHHGAAKPEIRLLVKAAILPLPTGQSTKFQDVSRSGMPCRSSH